MRKASGKPRWLLAPCLVILLASIGLAADSKSQRKPEEKKLSII